MTGQLALFDFRTMALLEDAGNHLDAGVKSGKERPVMGWPSLAIPPGVIVWYSLPGRNPYTVTMLERREAREHAAFVGDVMSEVEDILRETVRV